MEESENFELAPTCNNLGPRIEEAHVSLEVVTDRRGELVRITSNQRNHLNISSSNKKVGHLNLEAVNRNEGAQNRVINLEPEMGLNLMG